MCSKGNVDSKYALLFQLNILLLVLKRGGVCTSRGDICDEVKEALRTRVVKGRREGNIRKL